MSAQTQTAASPVTAFVMKEGEKFVCVVEKERIGLSKHADYFEYHLRRGDVKGLKSKGITKIAYVGDDGQVTKMVDTNTAQPAVKVPVGVQRAAAKAVAAAAATA